MTSRTIYITVGNTDNKLTQQAWAQFCLQITNLLDPSYGPISKLHGNWYSLPNAPLQNACWCVEVPDSEKRFRDLKNELEFLADAYDQDHIAFAVAEVEMIGPQHV